MKKPLKGTANLWLTKEPTGDDPTPTINLWAKKPRLQEVDGRKGEFYWGVDRTNSEHLTAIVSTCPGGKPFKLDNKMKAGECFRVKVTIEEIVRVKIGRAPLPVTTKDDTR